MAHATSVWFALLGVFMILSVFGHEKSPEGWPDLQQSTGKIEIAKIQEKTGSFIDNIVSFFTSFFSPEETEVENDPNLDEVANVKQETGSEKPTCKTCGRIASSSDSKTKVLPEDEIKAIRLNMALKVLQEKLRLSPKELTLEETKNLLEEFDKTHSELPAPLLDQIDESDDQAEEDDFYAWDKRKIFAGRLNQEVCVGKRNARCYNFELAGQVGLKIVSAQLWVHSDDERGYTVSVYDIEKGSGSNHLRNESRIAHDGISSGKEWLSLNVTETVQKWIIQGRSEPGLVIQSTHRHAGKFSKFGKKEGQKPFLVLEMMHYRPIRGKRSSGICDQNQTCCVRPLILTPQMLLHIGVRAQSNVSLGYCSGTCDLAMAGSMHTATRGAVRSSPYIPSPMKKVLEPCCVPEQLRPISICIFEDENVPCVQKYVSDIQVHKCTCL